MKKKLLHFQVLNGQTEVKHQHILIAKSNNRKEINE